MKIEITSTTDVPNWWNTPIVVITQNEYCKAKQEEIQTVISMLCNINCFEHSYSKDEHTEIINIFQKYKGCKVLFGVISNYNDSARYLEISVLSPTKKLFPIIKYDEKTDNLYLIKRKKGE